MCSQRYVSVMYRKSPDISYRSFVWDFLTFRFASFISSPGVIVAKTKLCSSTIGFFRKERAFSISGELFRFKSLAIDVK